MSEEQGKYEVEEGLRTTNFMQVVRGIAKHPMFKDFTSIVPDFDGMTAKVEMSDGREYEFVIKETKASKKRS